MVDVSTTIFQILITISGFVSAFLLNKVWNSIEKLKDRDDEMFKLINLHANRFEKLDMQFMETLKHIASIDEKLSYRIDRIEKEHSIFTELLLKKERNANSTSRLVKQFAGKLPAKHKK